jgi:hypothetical protein
MGISVLIQATFGPAFILGRSLQRRNVQVAWRLTSLKPVCHISLAIASLGAFVMLKPYTVKVVRAVLRGVRAVRP